MTRSLYPNDIEKRVIDTSQPPRKPYPDWMTAEDIEAYEYERRHLLATDSLTVREADELAELRVLRRKANAPESPRYNAKWDPPTLPVQGTPEGSGPASRGAKSPISQRRGPKWLHEKKLLVSWYQAAITLAVGMFLGMAVAAWILG